MKRLDSWTHQDFGNAIVGARSKEGFQAQSPVEKRLRDGVKWDIIRKERNMPALQ